MAALIEKSVGLPLEADDESGLAKRAALHFETDALPRFGQIFAAADQAFASSHAYTASKLSSSAAGACGCRLAASCAP